MPSRGYHTARLVCTRRPTLDLAPLAPLVAICDAWRAGEVPERPKGHAWRACVPTRYRGFESLPLRSTNIPGGPSAARALPRAPLLRCPQTPSASSSALALGRHLALRPSSNVDTVTLAPRASGGGG